IGGTKELAGKSADHTEILSASLARRVTSPDRHNDLPRARVPSPHAFRLVPLMHHAIRRFLRLNRRTIPSPARSSETSVRVVGLSIDRPGSAAGTGKTFTCSLAVRYNLPLPIMTDCAKSPPTWAEGTTRNARISCHELHIAPSPFRPDASGAMADASAGH